MTQSVEVEKLRNADHVRESVLDTDRTFWAFGLSEHGVPAIERDPATGHLVALIFTSKDLAHKYCYLRKPEEADSIVSLPTRRMQVGNEMRTIQSGIIKAARRLKHDNISVEYFVIDHPGTRGKAMYAHIEDLTYLGLPQAEPEPENDLQGLLDDMED
tara:strand:+ start:220039 stop:220512 length:474 start_codon:yes stop_codon:yes gene_type:complete